MFTQKETGICLSVRVMPNAKRSKIEGVWQESMLKIALHAPPVDGKANAELIDFLSDLFRVKKKNISLVRGETAREKCVLLQGITIEEAQAILKPFLNV